MMRFASPWFLIFLAIIPAAVYFRNKKQVNPSMGLSGPIPAEHIPVSFYISFSRILPVLKYIAFGLMVIAIARPQWGIQKQNILTEGINIILAVDISESMAALDFQKNQKIINRLEAVKGVVKEFIAERNGDRIGMVVFGSNAYTQIPLTRDYTTISYILDRLEIGAAGKRTAIGDAIGISLKRLAELESKSNIIILLTDGKSNSGELTPAVASEIASQKGVKIYTVAVGKRGKAPFLINNPRFGRRYIYQQVDIDEKTLKDIAEKTSGQFFRAEDVESLQEIYETIDQLEKTAVKVQIFSNYRDLYAYFLGPGFLLLVLWIILINTRFLRIP
jgi:Ca-activated chloride channel family protein